MLVAVLAVTMLRKVLQPAGGALNQADVDAALRTSFDQVFSERPACAPEILARTPARLAGC